MLLTRSPLGTFKFHPKTSFERTPFDLHVLGAPPAFVLSQDQTLYKMVSKRQRRSNQFYKSFDLCFAQTQSLASCTNYFWEFFKVLSKSLKRFRSSFDIVQFSRSCLLSRSSLFIISGKRKFVKHFFDFSLSRSVEPLSFVTALIYYHGLERLSTLFFHFLENSRQRLVFMCFAFCPVRLFTHVLL